MFRSLRREPPCGASAQGRLSTRQIRSGRAGTSCCWASAAVGWAVGRLPMIGDDAAHVSLPFAGCSSWPGCRKAASCLASLDVITWLRCRGGEVEAARPDGTPLRLAGPGCPPDFHVALLCELHHQRCDHGRSRPVGKRATGRARRYPQPGRLASGQACGVRFDGAPAILRPARQGRGPAVGPNRRLDPHTDRIRLQGNPR